MGKQSTIVRGEDRPLILRMEFLQSREPFDLVNWTKITVQFRKADRTLLEKNSDLVGGVFATVAFQAVNYTADIIGSIGNTILLTFDGIKSIATVILDWNTANPLNTVSSDAPNDAVIPTAGGAQLIGGVEPTRGVDVINETLSKISVNLSDADTESLKTGPNQSFKVIVDKGAHPNGERRIVLFDSALNVINADIS